MLETLKELKEMQRVSLDLEDIVRMVMHAGTAGKCIDQPFIFGESLPSTHHMNKPLKSAVCNEHV